MLSRLLLISTAMTAIAACANVFYDPDTGPSHNHYGTAAADADEGCAGGGADLLHQNRRGGGDYSTLRCQGH
jgi:hypothetical protein